jgi:hypothetical protein
MAENNIRQKSRKQKEDFLIFLKSFCLMSREKYVHLYTVYGKFHHTQEVIQSIKNNTKDKAYFQNV